jgi:hypothetical protein
MTESATLSVYRDEQGGTPLWQETQNVTLDSEGHYTAMLGSTQKDGVPVDLFSTAVPRWLGIQFNRPGEMEQPRIQLVSVPYALKASDAETLGGRPASAYLLDPNAVASGDANSVSNSGSASFTPALRNPKSLKPRSINRSMNYVQYFTDNNNDLGNSAGVNVNGANSNNIHVGNQGSSSDNATIRIGTPGIQTSFFAAGVYGVNSNGIPVYINSNGQLGTVSSSSPGPGFRWTVHWEHLIWKMF